MTAMNEFKGPFYDDMGTPYYLVVEEDGTEQVLYAIEREED